MSDTFESEKIKGSTSVNMMLTEQTNMIQIL